MYYRGEDNVIYLEDPESPTAVYSAEEWVIEKERLIVGLNSQINAIQSQIDNNLQSIEILDSYSQEVKDLIEQHNIEIPSTEDLEEQKASKQSLLTEVMNI